MRVRHGIKQGDADIKFGMALHVIFNSIKKVWNQFDASHTVFCLEGRSWRKTMYAPYKANRKILNDKKSVSEKEEDAAFFLVINEFVDFIQTKTNCSVLRHPEAEADDLIYRWIALHPNDEHVIISSDSDFQQLIASNVKIYNGIAGLLYTNTGVFDKDGNPAKNKKGEIMKVPDPEWILFEKCIRGDDNDNIFSSFPGVRTKKLIEAYNDRENKGFQWNNLMLSKWTDHESVEHRVKDLYTRNKLLIDLTQIPVDLVEKFDALIKESIIVNLRTQVGISLMRFCNNHGLVKIEKACGEFSPCLSSPYKGHLTMEMT
jgi:5'-3' exonuclease